MVTYRSHARRALALSTLAASAFFLQDGASAAQATTTTCTNQPQPAGPSYAVQRNEWSSGAAECVTTDGGPDFSVTSSAISNATDGAPGAYSFIYSGCFLGSCTSGALALDPPRLKDLTRGSLTTSVSANSASGIYNTAYDIWTATQPDTSEPVTGTEVMIWLNRQGPIQPAGYLDLSGVTIDGTTYDVWLYPHPNHIGNTVTFLATSGVTSMSGVDVYDYLQYVLNQGWASPDYYLTSVDAGFEIWQAGAGLRVNNFSVSASIAPQSAKAPAKPAATHTLGLDFGPGVKTVRVCGTRSAGGYGCTGWAGGYSRWSQHVAYDVGGRPWKRGKFSVYWNGGGRANWSSCSTAGKWIGSLRNGSPRSVVLGTPKDPVGPGHPEC